MGRRRRDLQWGRRVLLALVVSGCRQPRAVSEETIDGPPAPGSAIVTAQGVAADNRRTVRRAHEAWERHTRSTTDFAALPPWSEASGANPFGVLAWRGTHAAAPHGWLGLIRATGAVVPLRLDGTAAGTGVLTFVDATGWDRSPDGATLYVVGPRQGSIARVAIGAVGQPLSSKPALSVVKTFSLRDVAASDHGLLALTDPHAHRVLVVRPRDDEHARLQPIFFEDCAGPLQIKWTPTRLLANCTLDHRVVAWSLDEQGVPRHADPVRIEHDGPVWSMDAAQLPAGGVRLALGGVEDRALDRSDGTFGYIDSFAFVVDVPDEGPAQRRAALNVGEHGVVTPNWILVRMHDDGATALETIGYGAAAWVRVDWPADFSAPAIQTRTAVPGITALARDGDGHALAASPLLDAWVAFDDPAGPATGTPTLRPVAAPPSAPPRDASVRLGEALLFTTLIAPAGRTEGKASRFTCETCHFEGGVDGRVHWTGRGEVFAATRSIRGLFNNAPHFSRALDRSVAQMVDNEFHLAAKGTGADPWFSVSPAQTPWLSALGVDAPVDAVALREAAMAFILTFTHEPNPRAMAGEIGQAAVAAIEPFLRHCEPCHAARLVAEDPDTRVPPEQWLAHIRSPAGAIVWGSPDRHDTGVTPLVHPEGPRVPSLRRVVAKRPYFTNGSASSLQEAARQFSVGVDKHVRDAAGGRTITESERRSLQRFMELL